MIETTQLEEGSCGVPQGSGIGPLLFSVHNNDLHPSLSYSELNMYADGTSISLSPDSIPNITKSVNDGLLCLKTWMESNKFVPQRHHNKPFSSFTPPNPKALMVFQQYFSKDVLLKLIVTRKPESTNVTRFAYKFNKIERRIGRKVCEC